MTPNVQTITVHNSSLVILEGNGFNQNTEKNLVLIGNTNCNVISATENKIECVPGEGPLGIYPFSVNIFGKGLASLSTSAAETKYTFELEANSFSPDKSGTGGGVIVSISGKGFTKNTKVSIDGNDCPILTNSYILITCVVPSNVCVFNYLISI